MGGLVMLVGCGGWIEFIVVSVIVVGKEMVDEFVWLKLIKLEKFIFEFIFMEIFGLIEGGLELFIVMGMDFVLVECKLFFIWVVRILVEGVMFIILGDKGLKILFLIVGDIGGEVEDMDISFEVERIAGDDDDMGRDWTFTIVWIGNFFMFVLLFVFELGVILMFRYGFSFLISWGFGLDIVKFRFLSLVFKFVIFMFFRFMRGLFMFLEEFFVFCNIGRVFCIVVFCCCFFGIMDCNCIEGWSCIIVFVWIKGLFCIGDVWIGKELWSCVIIGVGLVIMLDFICVADGLDDCIWIFDWVWRDICGWVCIMGCFCSWVCIWIWGWVWMMVVWVGFMGCCIIIGGEVSLGCFCMLVCVFIGLGEDIGIGEVSNGTVFGLFVCICIEFGCLVLICWDEIIIGRLDVELGFLDWNFNCYCKNNCCCCSMMWYGVLFEGLLVGIIVWVFIIFGGFLYLWNLIIFVFGCVLGFGFLGLFLFIFELCLLLNLFLFIVFILLEFIGEVFVILKDWVVMGDSFVNDVRVLDFDTSVILVSVVFVVNVIGSVFGTENLREAGIFGVRGIMGGLNIFDMDEL